MGMLLWISCKLFTDYLCIFKQVKYLCLRQLRTRHLHYRQIVLWLSIIVHCLRLPQLHITRPSQTLHRVSTILHLPHPLFQKEPLHSAGVEIGNVRFAHIPYNSLHHYPHRQLFLQESSLIVDAAREDI
jgi:hypothetical protein